MNAERWGRTAPWLVALIAVAVVVLVVLPTRLGQAPDPAPPDPPSGPTPKPLDLLGESLDRCAAAVEAAGLADRYPERADWQPLARMYGDVVSVALLDGSPNGAVPFVCATGPTSVEVSDPRAAVPVDRALLLASGSSGLLAAVAPDGVRVEVSPPEEPPSGLASSSTFLRLLPTPITDPAQLAVTVDGVRLPGAPDRLAPSALRVLDRQTVPPDRSSGAAAQLRRCQGVDGAEPGDDWQTSQVLAYRRLEQPASLLVATRGSTVGGCTVGPGETTPLRPWGPGLPDGPRPFSWLTPFPDATPELAAGPVRPEVVRMAIQAADGSRWRAAVAGATFAAEALPGAPLDPRLLTVRAYAADDSLLYEGPAVG